MSLNRHMHPRNPYKEKPDFKELATTFADFRSHCSLGSNGKVLVNFQKDDAVRSLTKALLKRDFELEIDLPKGCLVPRVPQRLNYILWIEDLLVMNKMNNDVLGIDVGTGASCIYALLGARQCGWRFVATDVDEVAAETAHANVWRNGLADYIRVAHVDRSTLLRDVIRQFPSTQFTFCMCNPPFFECDETERRFTPEASSGAMVNQCNDESSEIDRPPPRSATLARKNELQVEVVIAYGGEVAFIGRMIDESVLLQSHVWYVFIYTTMLGKKSSVLALRRRLERIVGVRYTSSTLSQGRTARWVLAWTFRPDIELEEVITTTLLLPCSQIQSSLSPLEWIQSHLRELSIKVNREHDDSIICEARAATWTNQRARRRAEARLIDPANKRARSCIVFCNTYFPVTSQNRFVLRFRVRYCQGDDVVVPILLQAMGACAKERPEDPIAYVANYLLKEKSRFQPHKDPTTQ
uniref:U6 small nuclear RNA (adenine-(43)-N(6))-methyltransferase n=1 Tax=Heterorhabditis bacteriophora TaxID=37862 RepID=A0A1I7XR17_HETBA